MKLTARPSRSTQTVEVVSPSTRMPEVAPARRPPSRTRARSRATRSGSRHSRHASVSDPHDAYRWSNAARAARANIPSDSPSRTSRPVSWPSRRAAWWFIIHPADGRGVWWSDAGAVGDGDRLLLADVRCRGPLRAVEGRPRAAEGPDGELCEIAPVEVAGGLPPATPACRRGRAASGAGRARAGRPPERRSDASRGRRGWARGARSHRPGPWPSWARHRARGRSRSSTAGRGGGWRGARAPTGTQEHRVRRPTVRHWRAGCGGHAPGRTRGCRRRVRARCRRRSRPDRPVRARPPWRRRRCRTGRAAPSTPPPPSRASRRRRCRPMPAPGAPRPRWPGGSRTPPRAARARPHDAARAG